jgi:broad specificity phosphatase PhoE
MPSILLIRHAQASFGAADYDVLSELGSRQVAALVAGLEQRGVTAARVLSGTLRRQRDTAVPCAAAQGVEVELDPRWNEYEDRDILTHHSDALVGLERHAGDQPISSREFQNILNVALRSWIAAGEASPCRETWPQFRERLRTALTDVTASLGKGETALVVSSGGAISAVTATLLDVPPVTLVTFNHVSINAGISKLAIGRGGTTLISSNEHAHLEQAGPELLSYR